MTWGEFKKAVEAKGVTDESVLNYIDVSSLQLEGPANLSIEQDDGEIYIWN